MFKLWWPHRTIRSELQVTNVSNNKFHIMLTVIQLFQQFAVNMQRLFSGTRADHWIATMKEPMHYGPAHWGPHCFLYLMCRIISVSVRHVITCIEITCLRYTLEQLVSMCSTYVKSDSARNVWKRLWHKILNVKLSHRRFIRRVSNKLRQTGLLLNKITILKLWMLTDDKLEEIGVRLKYFLWK